MKKRELLIWEENNEINAEVRLFHSDNSDLYKFRDLLSDQIKNNRNLEIIKDEGFPTEVDSSYILIEKNIFEEINQKVKILRNEAPEVTMHPGLFDFLFKTKKYKQYSGIYKKRNIIENQVWQIINPFSQTIIQTTHDYPYLDCRTKIHKKEEFINEINNIAKKLDIHLDIVNKNPYNDKENGKPGSQRKLGKTGVTH